MSLPSHLAIPDESSTYTLRTSIDLDPSLVGGPIDLVVPRFAGIVSARANGQDLVRLNEGSPPPRHRVAGRQEFRLPAEATAPGRLEISLTVRNTTTRSAWFDTVPFLVRDAAQDPFVQLLAASEGGFWMAAWFIAQIALVYFWVFVSYPRADYGWLVAQGSMAIPYTLFSAGLIQVAPGVDEVLFAVPLAVAPVAAIHFAYHHVSLGRPPRVWLWLLGLAIVIQIAGHGPHRSTWIFGWVVCPLIISAGLFLLFKTGQEYRRSGNRRDAGTLFIAWLLLLILCAPDFLAWMGFGEILGGVRTASLGLALYAVSQGALLGRGHASSERELGRRLDETEKRNAEIGRLNDELRHQLQQRSRQLFKALALEPSQAGPAPVLEAGETVQGRYRVIRKIGAGGMGDVYEVLRLADQQRVALKLTHGLTGESLARLALEAEVASRLDHPHLVRIEDIDLADSGFLYIVMEYVDGPELTAVDDTGTALELLRQLANGLAALHEAGIVHRDLKPANVLVDGTLGPDRLHVKVADFGIASVEDAHRSSPPPRADATTETHSPGHEAATSTVTVGVRVPVAAHTPEDDLDGDTAHLVPASDSASRSSVGERRRARSDARSSLTRDGVIMGTPAYLAPELAEGARAGAAADIFAFGIVICEVLTGKPPFPRPAFNLRLADQPIPEPSVRDSLRPFGSDLADVVALALSTDPARRPTASELEAALRAAGAGTSVTVHVSRTQAMDEAGEAG